MDILRNADIVFQHLIDLPNCDCVFCSTRDRNSGETRLLLIFNEKDLILVRNGVKDSWGEVSDRGVVNRIRDCFKSEIEKRHLPCFSS